VSDKADEQKVMKPNCYECKHRGGVPGSCHSSCHHPAFKAVHDDPLMGIMAIFGSVGRAAPLQVTSDTCKVVGNEHGRRRGWFNHPMDFDPVWLVSCTGFEKKAEMRGKKPLLQQLDELDHEEQP